MEKILFADDEPDIVYLFRRFLEKGGFEVVEAYGGEEALKKTRSENPDLVILDVMMPDLDGWDVSRKIKTEEDTKHIPVVMLTVRTSFGSRRKSFEYGFADAHIGKPVNGKDVVKVIKGILN